MQFLDPTNPNPTKNLDIATLDELKGKRLAFINNGWMSMTKIGNRIESQLKNTYGVSEVVYYDVPRNTEPPVGLLDRVARQCDAAIVGMANWGGCSSWSVHDTTQLVKKGLPAAIIITEQFEKLAKAIMKSQHVPESVGILITGNPEFFTDGELIKIADRVLHEAVEILTGVRAIP